MYEIVLTATYETDVPAPVVVVEPTSLGLPSLRDGMVYNGELTLSNHSLIRADNVDFQVPDSDENYRFELLEGVPDSLGAKESITIPYRITCLNSLKLNGVGVKLTQGNRYKFLRICNKGWVIYG